MLRSLALLPILLLSTVLPSQGQAVERRASISIRARVVTALAPGSAANPAAGGGPETVPVEMAQRGAVGGVTMDDLSDLEDGIRNMIREDPGLVVMMMVLDGDGRVVREMASASVLPDWASDPSMFEPGAGTLQRDRSGYYVYIQVAACTI